MLFEVPCLLCTSVLMFIICNESSLVSKYFHICLLYIDNGRHKVCKFVFQVEFIIQVWKLILFSRNTFVGNNLKTNVVKRIPISYFTFLLLLLETCWKQNDFDIFIKNCTVYNSNWCLIFWYNVNLILFCKFFSSQLIIC